MFCLLSALAVIVPFGACASDTSMMEANREAWAEAR